VKRLILISVLVFCLISFGLQVEKTIGDVPTTLNYQGVLTDKNGNPLTGSVGLEFNIYDSEIGGVLIWGPEILQNVSVRNGLFSVTLGNITPLNGSHFEGVGSRYISIKVNGTDEMIPRQRINSVPYALIAGNASDAVPSGVIVMWSGAINNVPLGWALCDGTNGTPDLRDRFIVGAGNSYTIGNTGGEAMHVLTLSEMPLHTHMQDPHTHIQNPHSHNLSVSYSDANEAHAQAGENTDVRNISTAPSTATNQDSVATNQNTGGGGAHENRPPFYALAFIMKL
jgi:microcystin-dependent protein